MRYGCAEARDAEVRVLRKLRRLGDIEALPKDEWGRFLNSPSTEEFIAFMCWYQRCEEAEREVPARIPIEGTVS